MFLTGNMQIKPKQQNWLLIYPIAWYQPDSLNL